MRQKLAQTVTRLGAFRGEAQDFEISAEFRQNLPADATGGAGVFTVRCHGDGPELTVALRDCGEHGAPLGAAGRPGGGIDLGKLQQLKAAKN